MRRGLGTRWKIWTISPGATLDLGTRPPEQAIPRREETFRCIRPLLVDRQMIGRNSSNLYLGNFEPDTPTLFAFPSCATLVCMCSGVASIIFDHQHVIRWSLIIFSVCIPVWILHFWLYERPDLICKIRRLRGQCIECGYDMRHGGFPRCPECGSPREKDS